MRSSTYDALRGRVATVLDDLCRKISILVEYERKSTVMVSHVKRAIELVLKIKFYDGEVPQKRFQVYKKHNNSGETKGEKKKRKVSRRVQAMREIRFFQKQTHHFMIARRPFRALVRQIIEEFGSFKIQKGSLGLIQAAIECDLQKLLYQANSVAIHSKRITIDPKDVNLVVVDLQSWKQ